ncbi:uncharacterized protein N7500_001827 [Penicillium coprophilum]|uniref:uncharacterized protein n=1 Tax=Penicillium coprophilum TaxID=36646 RepID=UPI002399B0CD|nr:uncharacterized protein N7500_001827 [Penicillium coprophilum]KAJ5173896.1 hypothetical protein N7500_001827 [Penicillium coprophilum]
MDDRSLGLREGRTPLTSVAVRGHVAVAKLLLSTDRVQADFDMTTRDILCAFAPSKLSYNVLSVLDDYKNQC